MGGPRLIGCSIDHRNVPKVLTCVIDDAYQSIEMPKVRMPPWKWGLYVSQKLLNFRIRLFRANPTGKKAPTPDVNVDSA
ncbi:MAG: hypothetical protein ACK8QZ_10090, partial [Anaerolineales bacterium]